MKTVLFCCILFLSDFFWKCDVFGSDNSRPQRLSVNFLEHSGQVFLNGYPVNISLHDALNRKENFRITEMSSKIPFFGWIINSGERNVIQKAYRIIVSASHEDFSNEENLLWDSGKISSDKSSNIIYEGKALEPGKIYFWKVKTWDNSDLESGFSQASSFKMADIISDYSTDRYPLQKQDIYPVSISKVTEGCSFIDFGRAAFGRVRLNLDGEKVSDSVTVRLGETQKKGRVNQNPGGTIRYSEYRIALKPGLNTYILTIRPDKMNTAPRAIAMPAYIGEVTPFRYCEIDGYKGKIEKHQVVQEAVNYPFNEKASYFSCSDTIINQIWDLCKYSIKATSFTGIYIDGDRERIPYEADAYINQLGHYCTDREYSMARFSHEYLIHHPTWPTEWILQSVLMAWNDYLYTGNRESLKYFYDDLKAKTLVSIADESGFISTTTGKVTPQVLESIHFTGKLRDIVDWPQPGAVGVDKNAVGEVDGYVFRDVNTTVNAFHYKALMVMSEIASLLGNKEDHLIFLNQAIKLKKSFNDKLLDKRKGIYVDGIGTDHSSLHANFFPLAFGLVPDKYIKTVSEFIRSRGMACGVYGSQFLMDALYDSPNADHALKLLSSTELRSWYNMIRIGSTISLEAWDNRFKPNLDWNHAWGAVPANIIPRKLMGIEPLEPGFKKIRIKPQPSTLAHAEIVHPTIKGDVEVSFQNDPGNSFRVNVSIPRNCTADIYLPYFSKKQKVIMNGAPVLFEVKENFTVVSGIGSGKWIFETIKN